MHRSTYITSLAHGILCPSMSTAEEASKLVSCAKFPATTKSGPGLSLSESQKHISSSNLSGIRGVGSPFAPAVFHQTHFQTLDRQVPAVHPTFSSSCAVFCLRNLGPIGGNSPFVLSPRLETTSLTHSLSIDQLSLLDRQPLNFRTRREGCSVSRNVL